MKTWQESKRVQPDLISNQLNSFTRAHDPSSLFNYSWREKLGGVRGVGGGGGRCYLCKHWLPVLGDHGALIAVQGDAGVVEGLLGVLEDEVEVGDPALEHRAEVTGDQRPADRCEETQRRAQGC